MKTLFRILRFAGELAIDYVTGKLERKREPKPEKIGLTHKEVEHIQAQIRSATTRKGN